MKIMINDQMLQQSIILAGFDYSNLVNSFRIPNIYQTFDYIRLSYVYIFEYEHLKRFI